MTDRLWAPWRSSYVTNTGSDHGCLFCRIGSSAADRDDLVLCRRGGVFAVLNRFPYINGHLMLVPLRHVAHFSELSESESRDLFSVVSVAEKALREGMNCAGMNGGWNIGRCAGAGVEGHLHLHLLPRWPGDVSFMTTTAETRILSESLQGTYDRMLPWFSCGGDA